MSNVKRSQQEPNPVRGWVLMVVLVGLMAVTFLTDWRLGLAWLIVLLAVTFEYTPYA
jgi:hypothetical protein